MDNVRRILSVGLVTLSALVLAGPPASAQEGTLKKIKDTNTITLGHRDASIPFSYFDDKQAAVGYAMDLCGKIVDAVKAELKMPNLQVKLNPVTSATRIPLMANGTIDLECGSTTNNLERQKQVAFTITHFVTANRFVSKKAANLKTLNDLKGKTVVSTSGTTNIKQITELNGQQNLGITILPAKDHAEAFLMVESGRAVAFFMDDILLYSLVASSKAPAEWGIFWQLSPDGRGTYLDTLVAGLGWTLATALAAWVIALILGTIVGVVRTTPVRWLRLLGDAWVELFRNVPLLVQMFLWFFVVPELLPASVGVWLKQLPRSAFYTAVVCLSLYTSARV